jgi:hypothetical protein
MQLEGAAAVHPVPGYGGHTALLWLVVIAVPSVLVGLGVARRGGRGPERIAAGVAVSFIAFVALTRLPAQLQARVNDYRAGRGQTPAESEAAVQRSFGVDPGVLAFLAAHIRGGSFYMVTGDSVKTSGPQSWAQFELLPSLEEYERPCRAKWVVFFASPPRTSSVTVARPVLTYKPGYSLARNLTTCAS